MKKLTAVFSAISITSGRLVSWLTIGMVLVMCANVLMSWLFNFSLILLSETITWMHSANFLLASAYTLNRNAHVRVDIFYAKMSAQKQALVDLIGTLIFLLPLSIFIFWASWSYVILSWKIGEVSAEAGGLPAIFILKGMLLVMPVLLVIEGINQLFIQFNKFTNKASNIQGAN